MTDTIIESVRALRPEQADRADELFPGEARSELLARLRELPVAERRRPHPALRGGAARRKLVPVAALLAAVALFALLAGRGEFAASSASAVRFRTLRNGEIAAIVRNPFAAASELRAEFVARGLPIQLNLIPVSPTLVGTVIEADAQAGGAVEALRGGPCVTGGGGCPIGIRIAAGYHGAGTITLGRPARPGESYLSTASAFAAGEPLHCSGLLGAPVQAAARAFAARHLSVEWRSNETARAADGSSYSLSKSFGGPPSEGFLWGADTVAPGRLLAWAEPAPWPGTPGSGSGYDAGC